MVDTTLTRNTISEIKRSLCKDRQFLCNQCDYAASRKHDLVRHSQSVHKGMTYECGQCEYKTSHKGSLITHQTSVHEMRKYQCRECYSEVTIRKI